MKTLEEINRARGKLCAIIAGESELSKDQRILLCGMLNALVWVADGPDGTTVDRILSGERIFPAKGFTDDTNN